MGELKGVIYKLMVHRKSLSFFHTEKSYKCVIILFMVHDVLFNFFTTLEFTILFYYVAFSDYSMLYFYAIEVQTKEIEAQR